MKAKIVAINIYREGNFFFEITVTYSESTEVFVFEGSLQEIKRAIDFFMESAGLRDITDLVLFSYDASIKMEDDKVCLGINDHYIIIRKKYVKKSTNRFEDL